MRNFTIQPLPDCEEESVGGVGWRGVLHHSKHPGLKLPWCLIFRACDHEAREWNVRLFDTREKAEQFMDNLDLELGYYGGEVK